ncbi:MAG: glycosyltransferase family 39 protein [Deltaproteobacteria bacterium]|jgi:4-amino-4-deoxy-L-arabinose transferase-like glycosyltransferase|nr:glycosyltransferase family 39 protein [Deltaproteobacteria bacterium]MBW2537423.1 glycosyltransferase family 39 protein [Deltaproteobacteria bacterium]
MKPAASRIPRHRREDVLAWCVALAAVGTILWANGTLLSPAALLHLSDEGYIQAVAIRMVDGQMLPYVDGAGHRGPLLYWVAAIATAWFGHEDWTAIRVLGLGTMSLTALGAFLAGRAGRHPFAGALGAVAVAFVGIIALYPADGMSYNGEYLLDVFAMGGLLATAVGLGRHSERPRLGYVALAGACAALGALSKQSGAVLLPALGTWVLAAAASREGLVRRERFALLGAFAGGFGAPLALVALRYGAAGQLDGLLYYGWTYNVDVYMQTVSGEIKRLTVIRWLTDRAVLFGAGLALVLWGLRRPFSGGLRGWLRRWDEDGFTATVALGALLGLIACNTTLRSFWHYYVQIVPWFGCLAGLLIDRALARRSRGPRRATIQRVLVAAPMLLIVIASWAASVDTYRQAQERIREETSSWCAAIDEWVSPTEPLFVWGFRPDLYVWCNRRPASRFVYTTFVAGFVPWANWMTKEQEDQFATPGSRQELIAELEATQTPLIVDAGASLAGRGLLRYEELARYVRKRYCPAGTLPNMPLWARRTGAECPGPE